MTRLLYTFRKLSWTVHSDQFEYPEIESRKLSSIKKDDIIETISDLEENENSYTNQNNRHLKSPVEKRDHIIDISDGHVIVRNQGTIASINQKNNQQQHIIEAEVHKSATDISVSVQSHVTLEFTLKLILSRFLMSLSSGVIFIKGRLSTLMLFLIFFTHVDVSQFLDNASEFISPEDIISVIRTWHLIMSRTLEMTIIVMLMLSINK
jgi:hypothetical protein